jgi:hypothetical protein
MDSHPLYPSQTMLGFALAPPNRQDATVCLHLSNNSLNNNICTRCVNCANSTDMYIAAFNTGD